MKNKDVLVMDKLGLIPNYLKYNWREKMKYGPIECLKSQRTSSILFAVFAYLALAIDLIASAAGALTFGGVFVLAVIVLLFMWASARLGKPMPFTTRLEDHLNIFKEEHGRERYETLAESDTVARSMNAKALTYRAAVVKYAERKYDRGSRQADWARDKFDRIYLTETLLKLASEKKNDYYNANMRNVIIFPSDLETMAWMSDPDKTPITDGVPFEPTPVATGVTGML